MHKLLLIRHGESQWNYENRFTGWNNVDLTAKGIEQAKKAGSLISINGIRIDSIYCSYLKRAVNTCRICLNELDLDNLRVMYDWRLNERHYGALQGLNKAETAKKYGDNQVLKWRRSFDVAPPIMDINDDQHPLNDPLYKNINPELLPSSESLKDTLYRVKPLLDSELFPKVINGENIMVVAHGNSLRAIVKLLKNLSNEEIIKLNIPTGVPYLLELDKKLKVHKDYYLDNK